MSILKKDLQLEEYMKEFIDNIDDIYKTRGNYLKKLRQTFEN
jgi:hypothetical protein